MTGRYQAYPEYKDSGVEWLGNVPEHWEVVPLKRLCSLITGLTPPTENKENYVDDNAGYPWVRPEDLSDNGQVVKASKYVSGTGWKLLRHVSAQSTLICCIGTIGKVGYTDIEVSSNQQITAARFTKSPRYNFYLIQSAKTMLEEVATGNVVKILNSERLGRVKLLSAPSLEAAKIANFLDHETAKIDTLIEKQQQLIKLLKEKRQAVISHAVTKGLNPDVPMKDSGVEWLGEVPEHWGRSNLGFECSVKARLGWKGLKAEEYVEEGCIFLATPNIKEKEIDFENVNYITKERYDESPEIKLEVGDVLVTKDGSTTGTTNVVRRLPSPTTINSSIAVLRSNGRINSLYLYYFFVSTYTQNVIKHMQGGMGVPHLFQADLRKFKLLMPPLEEQLDIASYIEGRIPMFELLLEKAMLEIRLLKERRTALISAAVTGKIDVRNWQLPGSRMGKGVSRAHQ
ncbi:MAG: restriction endonuclease subunit S [Candidatus Scalindua rubra]|uniref:Putative restriction endonuclease n=1 Tax=Candidatus Scalindua brodae TaxID=237368 RepID=A0A0B0ELY6_9BACT|nr:MAG: putative restriction endonuclease [Candidatus Scalindua brodae]MBZ0107867.1 restriction endonuclease subunit S [Candidatus Scalindua rubra]TWU29169.1 Type-1 restriction enzyme EcoKI specificity protein [Candidatus Brocadiaceae bacterium S225]